jgi:hypothetical protein
MNAGSLSLNGNHENYTNLLDQCPAFNHREPFGYPVIFFIANHLGKWV